MARRARSPDRRAGPRARAALEPGEMGARARGRLAAGRRSAPRRCEGDDARQAAPAGALHAQGRVRPGRDGSLGARRARRSWRQAERGEGPALPPDARPRPRTHARRAARRVRRRGGSARSALLRARAVLRSDGRAAERAGIESGELRANKLDRESRHLFVETLKGLAVEIDGTLGFDQAEVTAGGLALSHVDRGTMRVKGFENLYACGEILDLAGPIGGLNFQSAFATAELAARDAARD